MTTTLEDNLERYCALPFGYLKMETIDPKELEFPRNPPLGLRCLRPARERACIPGRSFTIGLLVSPPCKTDWRQDNDGPVMSETHLGQEYLGMPSACPLL